MPLLVLPHYLVLHLEGLHVLSKLVQLLLCSSRPQRSILAACVAQLCLDCILVFFILFSLWSWSFRIKIWIPKLNQSQGLSMYARFSKPGVTLLQGWRLLLQLEYFSLLKSKKITFVLFLFPSQFVCQSLRETQILPSLAWFDLPWSKWRKKSK